jgi:hypothetical protein
MRGSSPTRPFSDVPLLPDATPLPDTRASPFPAAGELDRADVRPSPRYDPDVRPLHDSPSSPCRGPGGASPRRPLLHERRRPSSRFGSMIVPASQPDWYAACRPPCAAVGRRLCARMAGRATRWCLALLTPAREMLASANLVYQLILYM